MHAFACTMSATCQACNVFPGTAFGLCHGCRCNTAPAQQQLQRHFEAQFLHKPQDLKAKLKGQLLQQQQQQQHQQQQQQHQQHAGQQMGAELKWMNCMPAAGQQEQPLRHGKGKVLFWSHCYGHALMTHKATWMTDVTTQPGSRPSITKG